MPRAAAPFPTLFVACLVVLLASGCGPKPLALASIGGGSERPGSIASVEKIGAYSALALRLKLWRAHLPEPVVVRKGVRLYRMTYWSKLHGEPALLSGLIALPESGPLRGTVVWMHESNIDRRQSVSAPSSKEGVLQSGMFAGGGYLYAVPDRAGLGVSKAPQAFMFNAATIESTMDFLHASQTLLADLKRTWSPEIYVAGFSQGGHAAAVIARELERRAEPSLRLQATAAVAGPYDLADTAVPWALKGKAEDDSAYLSLLALSYATYYDHPLESILTPESASRTRRIFDGDHPDEVGSGLPANPKDLFNADVLSDLTCGRQNWFVDALRQNSITDWAPKAPYRAYYGDKDVDVPPQDSVQFAKRGSALGGNVVAVDLGPYSHGESDFHALPKIRAWFDTLSDRRPPPG